MDAGFGGPKEHADTHQSCVTITSGDSANSKTINHKSNSFELNLNEK
jgi:hypothetical protein